jgi:hypothetical protein
MPSSPQAFLSFNEFAKLWPFPQRGSTYSCEQSFDAWFLSQKSWYVNWFSKQSAITLTFSFGWYVIPKGPWIAAGAFGPSLFIRDFAIGYRAWGVTSQFSTFVSHCCSAFLRVIRLMVLETQLSAVLHYGSRVICHSFLNLRLCFSKFSRSGISLLMWKSVILLVAIL